MESLGVSNIEYYNKAVRSISKNNITKAVFFLEKGYKLNGDDCDVNNLLGLCYFKICEFKKASFLWKKSILINNFNENKAHKYLEFINSDKVEKDITLYNTTLELIVSGNGEGGLSSLLELQTLGYSWVSVDILISLLYLKKNNYSDANKFIKGALTKDIGNQDCEKYYKYILEIKQRRRKNIKTCILSGVAIFTLVLMVKMYSENLLKSDENVELNSKNDYQVMEIKEKEKYIRELETNLNNMQGTLNNLFNEESNQAIYSNELKMLQHGLEIYELKRYDEALNIFNLILDRSNNESVLNEVTFWMASAYEGLGKYELAISFYEEYITKFKDYYYYDDTLYMMVILLEKINRLDESKKYANKLINECSDSMYNNIIIKNILER